MYQVLIRIIGTDDAMHAFHEDTFNWLADTNLLDMLLDKLSPPVRLFYFKNSYIVEKHN